MILATFDIPRSDSGNSDIKTFSVQGSLASEETFYGKFRMLVKQRYFGIKLEEGSFMEFIDANPKMKDKLGDFLDFMGDLKSDFIGYLKKNHPEKVEKRKKKKKGKKKELPADAPGHPDAFSGEYNSTIWKEEMVKLQNEVHVLESKIGNIKNNCCFELIGNVKKIIDLVDDVVAKYKIGNSTTTTITPQKTPQKQQVSPPGLPDLGFSQEPDDISYYFPGVSKAGNKLNTEVPVPTGVDYFQELYFSINKTQK